MTGTPVPSMPRWSADLTLALELADLADSVSMDRFGAHDLRVAIKADGTPVSDADQTVEDLLRRRLGQARPGQGIVGEERFVGCGSGAAVQWVLDPIDGTKNYVRGIPVWATLIGLERDGSGLVGVVSAPALGRRWWAARGEGAWIQQGTDPHRKIQVSATDAIGDAWLSYDGVIGFEDHGLLDRFLDLCRRCQRTRAFGDFWSHMMVAEGSLDIAVEPEVAHWDVAAVAVIVCEAGGRFSDLSGRSGATGKSAVSTNGRLHGEVLLSLVAD